MNVTVFCASRELSENINRMSGELGKFIASRHHTLVYGGCSNGLMGVISSAVKDNGGKVIGVLPDIPKILEVKKEGLDDYIHVQTMGERIEKLISLGDVIVTLPGGPGTLNEISSVIDALKLGTLNKTLIIYNIDHYYDDLQGMIEKYYQYHFVNSDFMGKVKFVTFLDEIEDLL